MSQTQATHTESIDGRDPDPDVPKKAKSRRPASEIHADEQDVMGGHLTDNHLVRYRIPTTKAESMAVSQSCS